MTDGGSSSSRRAATLPGGHSWIQVNRWWRVRPTPRTNQPPLRYTFVYGTHPGGLIMPRTAKVFMTNRSQAVRLPKE